jgi:hypothetical protein
MQKVTKKKKCVTCKNEFMPTKTTQRVCGLKCAVIYANALADKINRLQELKSKREHKAKLVALKSIPDLIKEAQVAFNAFIRYRDKDKLCICCDKPYGTNHLGGNFDAGHYRSRGAAGHLRFNEDNCFGQRKYCNTYGADNFREGVIKRIGLDRTRAIENNNKSHKWSKDELIAIKALYKEKLKELKKSVDT